MMPSEFRTTDTIRSHIYFIGRIKNAQQWPAGLIRCEQMARSKQEAVPAPFGIVNGPVKGTWTADCVLLSGLGLANTAPNKVSSLSHFLPFWLGLIGTCWQQIPSEQEPANQGPPSVISAGPDFHSKTNAHFVSVTQTTLPFYEHINQPQPQNAFYWEIHVNSESEISRNVSGLGLSQHFRFLVCEKGF